MTDLAQQLSETIRSHASGAPTPADLAAAVRDGLTPRLRGWAALGLLTAAIAVAGTLVVVNVVRSPATRQLNVVTRPAGPIVPAGMQAVSFHGLQVFVPASWKLNNFDCGQPISDTVYVSNSGPVAGCYKPPGTPHTVVNLLTADEPDGKADARLASQPITVDGHSARRGLGIPKGQTLRALVLVVPGVDAVIAVTSPDLNTAERVMNTARVVPVDSNGCRDHVAPLHPGRTQRAGTALLAVPGRPLSAALCRYSGDWLASSLTLSSQQADRLRTILNTLPPGTSRMGFGESESLDACAQDDHRGFIATFTYPQAAPLDVYVHISGCDALSAANGARTTRIDGPLVDFLTGLGGYDSSFPDPTTLR